VRPAEDERTLRAATDAIAVLGVRLVAPTPPIARDAARHRGMGVSLADGFAIATAEVHQASVATFDRRVRRVLDQLGVPLAAGLRR
jgi:predicted nucleic acid-binding protein